MGKRFDAVGDAVRPICDRFWLFTIAALALGVTGFIVGSVVINGRMPEGAGELMASTVTGLLMIVQKVIEAQQQRRMADYLHQSQPHQQQAAGKEDDSIHQMEDES